MGGWVTECIDEELNNQTNERINAWIHAQPNKLMNSQVN